MSFTILDLPSPNSQTVEERLLEYFEGEERNIAQWVCRCGNKRNLVQLRQPVQLPTLLICNMLSVNKSGCKDRGRIKPQCRIQLHNVDGEKQSYNLSACIVHYGNNVQGHFNCMVVHNKQWYSVDDTLVEPRRDCETGWHGDIYLMFYTKLEKNDVEEVVIDEDSPQDQRNSKTRSYQAMSFKASCGRSKVHVEQLHKPFGICDTSMWLIQKVANFWDIDQGQDLDNVVSVIGGTPIRQYDIKLLDDQPSELEIKILNHFATLRNEIYNKGWLNDKIINSFFSILKEKTKQKIEIKIDTVSSFMYTKLCKYGVHSITKWFKKQAFFQSDLCFFPINHDNKHWCLGVVDFRTNIISYYDPLALPIEGNINGLNFHKKARLLIAYLAKIQALELPHLHQFTNHTVGEPMQHDPMSCGVFICMVADYLTKSLSMDFTQNDISLLRKYIAVQIANPQVSMLQMPRSMQAPHPKTFEHDHQAYTRKGDFTDGQSLHHECEDNQKTKTLSESSHSMKIATNESEPKI